MIYKIIVFSHCILVLRGFQKKNKNESSYLCMK